MANGKAVCEPVCLADRRGKSASRSQSIILLRTQRQKVTEFMVPLRINATKEFLTQRTPSIIVAYLTSSDVVRTGHRYTNKNFPKTDLTKQGQNTREGYIKYLVDVILQKFNKSFQVLRLYAKKYRSRNQLRVKGKSHVIRRDKNNSSLISDSYCFLHF